MSDERPPHVQNPDGCTPENRALLDWAAWKGDGPAPAHWYAVNSDTGERTKVYRSYSDYCDD